MRTVHNYDLLAGHAWYTPGVSGLLVLTAWLLLGALLGNVASFLLLLVLPQASAASSSMLVSYPLMFLPAMIYVRAKSQRDALFGTGYRLDNHHFGAAGAWGLFPAAVVATWAAAFALDWVPGLLPEMPELLKNALEAAVGGPLWINILVTCLFAPFFEEWLCRGILLRGMLNCRRESGRPGIKPAVAICLSALFFGLIHLNPWQAIPAFALGCLFGYAYYKTGSLRLTMAMHAANNALALTASRLEWLKETESWADVLSPAVYAALMLCCLAVVAAFILLLRRIPSEAEGNCDPVRSL